MFDILDIAVILTGIRYSWNLARFFRMPCCPCVPSLAKF